MAEAYNKPVDRDLQAYSLPLDRSSRVLNKPIFDAFRYRTKPTVEGCGLNTIKIFYPWELFGSAPRSQPNLNQIKNVVVPQILSHHWNYVVIDIEHWDPILEMDKYIAVMRTIRNEVRAGGGKSKLGYYRMLPERNFLEDSSASALRSWKATNGSLAALPRKST